MVNKILVKGKRVGEPKGIQDTRPNDHPVGQAGCRIRDTGIIILCVLCASVVLYAADDVKIKLTDDGGVSNFAIQDSSTTAVFRVNSDGHTQLLSNAELRLYNSGNTYYTGFKAPALGGNYIYTLPQDFGTNGYVLSNNSGTLSWVNKLSSISSTTDRITISGGDTVDIASNYAGQNTITTLGTIGTGIWNGTTIKQPYIAIGTGAGDADTLTLHDFLTGTPATNKIPKWDGTNWAWADDATGGGTNHSLLDGSTHPDTTAGTVARGDIVTGQGATPKWTKLAKGTANQVLSMDATATDVVWATPAGGGGGIPIPTARKWFMVNASAATWAAVGVAAPTSAGTDTNSNDAASSWVNIATGTTAGTAAGIISAAFTLVQRQHDPYYMAKIQTGSNIAAQRIWIGLHSAAPGNSDSPATSLVAFRFSTVAPDTNWMACTKDGTTLNAVDTGVVVAVSTNYLLEITVNNTAGTAEFKINGSVVATLNTNLPAAATNLGYNAQITPTTTTAKNMKLSRVYCELD